MDNKQLRETIVRLFSEDFELNTPRYGQTTFEGQELASDAMVSEFGSMEVVINQFFPNLTFEQVDHYGGEGKGEEYWTVVKFECEGESQLVRFEGYYQSHYGTDFSDWNFVKPVEVTITAYEIN